MSCTEFESTRLTAQDRIENRMAVLAIAFAWAHKMGDWLHTESNNGKKTSAPGHQLFSVWPGLDPKNLDWLYSKA